MRRILLVVAVLGLALAALLLSPRATHRAPPPVPAETAARSAPPPEPSRITHPEVGFRSHEALAEHFHKHGRELNARDEAAYLAMAQTLRDRPAGGLVLEAVRRDGVVARFDRTTGAFIAFNADLTIRTFFRPSDGEAYFRRQLEREH